jgi:hypothetical protein
MAVISIPQAPEVRGGTRADVSVTALVQGFLRIYRACVRANREGRLAADSAVGESQAYAEMRGM